MLPSLGNKGSLRNNRHQSTAIQSRKLDKAFKELKSQNRAKAINWEAKMLTQWLANAKDLSQDSGSAN